MMILWDIQGHDGPAHRAKERVHIQFAFDGAEPGLDKFHLHVRCFAAWEFAHKGWRAYLVEADEATQPLDPPITGPSARLDTAPRRSLGAWPKSEVRSLWDFLNLTGTICHCEGHRPHIPLGLTDLGSRPRSLPPCCRNSVETSVAQDCQSRLVLADARRRNKRLTPT
jgi:hypothetical protein